MEMSAVDIENYYPVAPIEKQPPSEQYPYVVCGNCDMIGKEEFGLKYESGR